MSPASRPAPPPRPGAEVALSRYAVDQLAHRVVLDITKARGCGWAPRRTLEDFLAAVRAEARGRG
ncbi:hypothetical protein [Streptomyces alboverticillatus]|uniref:hypothetical protein n=1 Tax=Streptomyces alboverticillatus TaxID=173770 RepID=UPI000A3A8663|nr:hypothetical protein [Streptomyces alboverticillatus]